MTTATATPALSLVEAIGLVEEFVSVLNAKQVSTDAARGYTGYGYNAEQYCFYAYTLGKKYARITQSTGGQYGGSVHAFVNLATGDVLKAAGYNAPAKGVRFNLVDVDSKTACYEAAEFTGGYLYL